MALTMNTLDLWQDCEVKFDIHPSALLVTLGEQIIETFESVEDAKGNCGDLGTLQATNLRIIWRSNGSPKVNLSIGYDAVSMISVQLITTKAKGSTETVYILTKTPKGRFEFVFSPLQTTAQHVTEVIVSISKAYTQSKMFRELRLRSHIIQGKQVKVLPGEQVCSRREGVWNLASNQGNLGCFVLTNVRLIWFASMNELFNISLPYIQVSNLFIRDSKFGLVLVIETSEKSGAYLLGFRIDPVAELKAAYQEIRALFDAQIRNPVLGCSSWVSSSDKITSSTLLDAQYESSVKNESSAEHVDTWAAYWAHNEGAVQHDPPVRWEETGLAIEKLPPGITMESLWNVPV